jgi:hypothetical protein
LKWDSCELITIPVFQNTTQIKEWGKSFGTFASLRSEQLRIMNSDVFILEVDLCSGIYCPSIYVFKLRNKLWQLIASSNSRLKEQIEIKADTKLGKIIFKTKSSQIGELPFEMLDLSSDKDE